jgi:hypothetical protein
MNWKRSTAGKTYRRRRSRANKKPLDGVADGFATGHVLTAEMSRFLAHDFRSWLGGGFVAAPPFLIDGKAV